MHTVFSICLSVRVCQYAYMCQCALKVERVLASACVHCNDYAALPYLHTDTTAVDDLNALSLSGGTQQNFANTYQMLSQKSGTTVITLISHCDA